MKPVIAISMGDPAGIGPEIVVKSLVKYPDLAKICEPVVVGNRLVLERAAKLSKLEVEIENINYFSNKFLPEGTISCYDIPLSTDLPELGKISAECGEASFHYVSAAIDLVQQKKAHAIATAPINKQALQKAEIPYLDHTEILTKLTKSDSTMTLFMTGDMFIFFYSRHIRFRDIVASLDADKISKALIDCSRHLERLGFSSPRIALAALNPHAGEDGLFGDEEREILAPAIEKACKEGVLVVGPVPADSVFHQAKEGWYTAVLALYHDQGHIAAKTYDFHSTISLTMGLPFIRTSVDHGTAMDIAGKGVADERGMVEAIRAAARYAWADDV